MRDLSPELTALVQKRQENLHLLEQYKHLVQRMDALSKVQDSSSNGNSHQGRQQMHVDYDLGQGFTCEAVVPDTSKINVSLGLPDRLVAELTLDEARDFCHRKIDLLEKSETALAKQEAALRQDLEVVTDAFKQALKNMKAPGTAPS